MRTHLEERDTGQSEVLRRSLVSLCLFRVRKNHRELHVPKAAFYG